MTRIIDKNADRLEAAYQKAHGDNRPFLERNSGKLLVICLSGLIALGSVSWAWSKVNQAIADHVEIEVQ